MTPWFGILPIAAGFFGVPVGLLVTVAISLAHPPPDGATRNLVRRLRYAELEDD
ncbi:MAG: hypothetical protein ACFCBW_12760 [Candidatus Competibacterales bacterium]